MSPFGRLEFFIVPQIFRKSFHYWVATFRGNLLLLFF